MKRRLVPAILAKSYEEFKAKLRFVESFASEVQIDVMDGIFVDNVTYADAQAIGRISTTVRYELHLMVDRPEEVIPAWHEVRQCVRYIVHYETFHKRKSDLYDILKEIKVRGREVGIAINPPTPISTILEFLPLIDQLLVMGVVPGWSGQQFDERVLQKIQAVRNHYPELVIAVDGGVSSQNYQAILAAGANVLDAASMVFDLQDRPDKLQQLIVSITQYSS